jgi:hypothetical protein
MNRSTGASHVRTIAEFVACRFGGACLLSAETAQLLNESPAIEQRVQRSGKACSLHGIRQFAGRFRYPIIAIVVVCRLLAIVFPEFLSCGVVGLMVSCLALILLT